MTHDLCIFRMWDVATARRKAPTRSLPAVYKWCEVFGESTGRDQTALDQRPA